MDRIIEVRVAGNHITKDNNRGGVQGEANVTKLRLTFDPGWDGYAKTVTFWNALHQNPVKRTLALDLLENMTASTRVYLCPIPGEALTVNGTMAFTIDGYLDGVRQRTVGAELEVEESLVSDNAGDPADPTPSQAEQLQAQMEGLLPDMQEQAVRAESAAGAALAQAGQAAMSASAAQQSAHSASVCADAAQAAQRAAEHARDEADRIAGGDFATKSHVAENYVPLDGSVAMTGRTLYLNGKAAAISTDGKRAVMNSYETAGSNAAYRSLIVRNKNEDADVSGAIGVAVKDSGDSVERTYRIYGEHNKPTAADVGAVEAKKNLTPDSSGYDTLLQYMASRYNDHAVVYANVSGFSDMPTGVTGGQATMNMMDGILTATLRTRTDVYTRGTNSLSSWTGEWRKVYDAGSKPAGTYTGNGSTAKRTISTGGIGDFVIVQGNHSVMYIASPYGAVSFNLATGATRVYLSTSVNFTGGVLTLATNDGELNANGAEFRYQVL